MVISVDDRFTSLINELDRMGYEVHRFSENIKSDIVIYSGESGTLFSLYSLVPVSDARGVFFINGDNKSGMEICSIISNRSYSSIFKL